MKDGAIEEDEDEVNPHADLKKVTSITINPKSISKEEL